MYVQSFAPLGNARATRLVLGTMPGRASLLARQYYAHPRNAFWYIIQELFGIPQQFPYPLRVRKLAPTGLAVWDVLAACTRGSSLDSDILPASAVPNDFARFLAAHRHIHTIYFNGTAARQLFERHVLRGLPPAQQGIARIQLPSTSPTNARMSLAEKARAWRVING
ncbi:MAG TPA: DNA-deoxyinosine glycosylase [Steroidobacteraceae bacterium]|nr:DNA-deoxyinosine glycosylase [Steroidobacteraceae bacterium]